MILSGSGKTDGFISELIFSGKGDGCGLFGGADRVVARSWRSWFVLFISGCATDDAHFIDFFIFGRVVGGWTGTSILFLLISNLLSYSNWGEKYFHAGVLVRVVFVRGL